MKNKIKLLIAVVCLVGLFGGGNVLAVDTSNMSSMMTISPPREKIVLVPGEVYEGSIKVSNSATASKNLKYSVRVGSFGFRDDENGNTDYYNTDVDTITSYNEIMKWISLGKEGGEVLPNESDIVPYTITVPKDAPAGGQYASIIVRNDTTDDSKVGNVAIQNVVEFAVSVIAEVAGETRDEGKILENSIPAIQFTTPLNVNSMVRNDGNVHTDAKYTLQVWPLFSDEEICTNEEKPETSLIMPDSERYHAQTCNTPALGIFRVKQVVKIFGETSIVEKTILVCPIWLLFVIVFAIVFVITWFFTKNKNRKAKKEEI